MEVVVTGAGGLLGWWVARVLAERGYRVYGVYRERGGGLEGVEWVRADLEAGVPEVVRRADVVIHAAAYTDVDGCEVDRARAYRANFLATLAVARAARRVVYISTDYVFDGERGMYREEDVPNPVNYYGLSKLLGEGPVLARGGVVVRVSGLFGVSPHGKRNFGVEALLRLRRGEEVRAFVDQRLSPTYVPFLAERLADLLERDVEGVLHIAGEPATRFEFAVALAEALGVDRGLVKPARLSEARLVARRPRDSSLDTSRAASMGLSLPPLREALRHFVKYAV